MIHTVVVTSALAAALLANGLQAQDTVRIRSTSAPKWGSSVKLTQQLSIGVLDGPEEYAFGFVGGLAVDKSGRFYIADGEDHLLRQYSAAGKFIRNIGRPGKGPGEYLGAASALITDDSVIAISDQGNRRISFFNPNGTFRSSFNSSRIDGTDWRAFTVDKNGLVYVGAKRAPGSKEKANGGPYPVEYRQLLRFRPNGTVVDSLPLPPPVIYEPGKEFTVITEGLWPNNFLPRAYSASLKSGGYVAGKGDAMRLVIHPSIGPLKIVERAFKPVELGSEERAIWMENAEWLNKNALKGVPPVTLNYQIPKTKPVFRELLTDNDSRIWVDVYSVARKIELPPRSGNSTKPRINWMQPTTYEVFSDQGEYLGRVELPMHAVFLAAQGNQLWVRESGPDDEIVVRKYQMSGSAALRH